MVIGESLVPVPPHQPGVCSLCYQWAEHENRVCQSCKRHGEFLGLEISESGRIRILGGDNRAQAGCLPNFLRVKSRFESYDAGWQYKDSEVTFDVRHSASNLISRRIKSSLRHEQCLAKHLTLPVEKFDAITWIPSRGKRSFLHPLATLLVDNEPGRVDELLRYYGEPVTKSTEHTPRIDMWKVIPEIKIPRSVLLFDDTWTTGATMLSATLTLLKAGVQRVGLMPLGRHLGQRDAYQSPGHIFEEFFETVPWQPEHCALCDSREQMFAKPDLLSQYQTERFGVDPKDSKIWGIHELAQDEVRKGERFLMDRFGLGEVIAITETMIAIDFGTFGVKTFSKDQRVVNWD